MPKSIYDSLNIDPLKSIGMIIQLAYRSNVYPDGIVDDVLVQVDDLVFPVNFYTLDMEGEHSPNVTPILLGRPFLKIAKIKIDVHAGTLTIEFDGALIGFNILDAIKHPHDDHSSYRMDVIEPLA